MTDAAHAFLACHLVQTKPAEAAPAAAALKPLEPLPVEPTPEETAKAMREMLYSMKRVARDVDFSHWPTFLHKFTFLSGEKDRDAKVTFPRPLDSLTDFSDEVSREVGLHKTENAFVKRDKSAMTHKEAVVAKLRSYLGAWHHVAVLLCCPVPCCHLSSVVYVCHLPLVPVLCPLSPIPLSPVPCPCPLPCP